MTQQLTPEEAYTWATQIMPNCQNKQLEQIIMTSPHYAYWYAIYVIQGKWTQAEPTIAKNKYFYTLYHKYCVIYKKCVNNTCVNNTC
jgi:hypothetical protein